MNAKNELYYESLKTEIDFKWLRNKCVLFENFNSKFFGGKISFCNILDARQTTLYAKHVTTNYIWQLKYTSNLIFRAIWMSGGLNATPTYHLKRTFV